ncbi:MAG: peptidase M4 family protein [Pyrinomonadaceae bacterium]|nr:peptidase M4 family protein [Pyrinomonadaceae bacterium]
MRKLLTLGLLGTASAVLCLSLTAHTAAQSLAANQKQEKLALAEQRGLDFLQSRSGSLNLRAVDEFRTKRVFVDEDGVSHLHVQQTYLGVPVFGGEAIVHLQDDGAVSAFTDTTTSNIKLATVVPSFDGNLAAEKAIAAYGCGDCLTAPAQTDLFVLRRGKRDNLVYRVQLRREDGTENTSLPVYFINANTGKTVWQYDNLQTATGSGQSLYSGNISFTTYQSGSTFYLEDVPRKVGTFDSRNTTSSIYRFTDTDNIWSSASQRAGDDAHYGAAKVYDYFLGTHNRRGIDGSGGPAYYTSADGRTGLISSIVHYSTRYNNAFWNGQYMTYGDGDGTTFTPLVTLDICGHEMTHGITERTAGLVYSNESGALNEAVSDIFGAMVERYTRGESADTWKIGESAYTPSTSGDALRYMDNPTRGNQPDFYATRYIGTGDNGGVHINSGIANYEFYLLAKGGTTPRGASMTGIGADKAARIWYRALTSYMTSNTNFRGARTATLNSAAAIYGTGTTEYNAVANSWTLVGVN